MSLYKNAYIPSDEVGGSVSLFHVLYVNNEFV